MVTVLVCLTFSEIVLLYGLYFPVVVRPFYDGYPEIGAHPRGH